MSEEQEAAEGEAEAEAAEARRDPSEKQEPHTVMWGKRNLYTKEHARTDAFTHSSFYT